MLRNLAVIGFFAGAYASNPDEASFRRFVEAELKKDGSNAVMSKIIAHLSTHAYPREDYHLFSLVRVPEANSVYVGLFGNWLRWPPSFLEKMKLPPTKE